MFLITVFILTTITMSLYYIYKYLDSVDYCLVRPQKQIVISLDGNIGSGKSTLINILKKNVDKSIQIVEEPVQLWQTICNENKENILDLFYKNNTRWAYTFQNLAFITRTFVLSKAKQQNVDVIILERSTETDKHVFAKCLYDTGKMSKMEYDLYNICYNKFSYNIDGYVYLRTNPDNCMERIHKRNRSCENKMEKTYIESMDEYHDNWLLDMEDKCLVVDGNTHFKDSKNIQSMICNQIIHFIDSIRYT